MTIAKEVEIEDKFENMGAQLVREVASKTNDVAGDGTTTATVLAQSDRTAKALKLRLRWFGNPLSVKRGHRQRPSPASLRIQNPRESLDQGFERIASGRHHTRANNDPEIGELSPMPWIKSARRVSSRSKRSRVPRDRYARLRRRDAVRQAAISPPTS